MKSLKILALPSLFTIGIGHAAILNYVRPDYQNLSSANTGIQAKNASVVILQGSIKPAATAPSGGTYKLTECAFGQPFSQWTPDDGSYAAGIVAQVRTALYPPVGATRAAVEGSTAAFRYKYLLYSPNPGETDVTNHFQNIGTWFGDTERALANAQITLLRDAIAQSPFDTGLRNLLLDIYYDLAVAEMQFATKKLADLATMRLGFVQTGPFIIDDEITAYQNLVSLVGGVLDKYGQLLGDPIDGVEPSDFDPDPSVKKMPMGYYLFLRAQKTRNSTPSQYADNSGVTKTVPTTGTDPGGPTLPAVTPRPDNEVLFAGYKDYTTLLTIMGRYVQYQADLARLRGMRQGSNDLSLARSETSKVQRVTGNDYARLRKMFPSEPFLPGDASGVNAANNSVDTAFADITNVRNFLNGKSNALGLDPQFLLLVQENSATEQRESFDILKDRLLGTNQPLKVALDLMADAESRYNTFRASVDRVVQEMADIEDSYRERYHEITGYEADESPGFKGTAKPNVSSELYTAEQTIASLGRRLTVLNSLRGNLDDDLKSAGESVGAAESLRTNFLAATETYKTTTSNIYTEQKISFTVAAAAQAVADGAYTALSLDPGNAILSGGGTAGAIAAAAVLNGAAQSQAAYIGVDTEQRLDYAALEFETTLDKSDAELTVNQAKQELGAVKREIYAHDLEMEDTTSQLTQAQAQRTALLNELRRIEENLLGNTAAVRSKYYADPIHYIRAENALIEADESFRTAQRWLFYTQRALEYKWNQTFAITQGSKSWDSGSIFKLRNAKELDALLTQMVNWDAPRTAEVLNSPTAVTFISMKNHLIAPNPNQLNTTPAKTADTGVRVDFKTGETVSQVEFFRRRLREYTDGSGFVSIPFNTVLLEDLDGNFFRGADYLPNGTIIPGAWRDKILSIKVNLISTDGTATPTAKSGSLIYSGNTFQRTRRPLRGDRTRPSTATGDPKIFDIGGEFTVSPFRYWESANFDNIFVPLDRQITGMSLAFSNASARSGTGEDILGDTFKNVSFAQRSVAATGWTLIINPNQVDINKLTDIEIIVRHRFSDRAQPN